MDNPRIRLSDVVNPDLLLQSQKRPASDASSTWAALVGDDDQSSTEDELPLNAPSERFLQLAQPTRRSTRRSMAGARGDTYANANNFPRTPRLTPLKATPSAVLIYQLSAPADSYESAFTSSRAITKAKYLPLYLTTRGSTVGAATYSILPSHRHLICVKQNTVSHAKKPDISGKNKKTTWPIGRMPVELFAAVTQYLSRNDIKSMRLVSREFERGVSGTLFHTAVVPFNTELYDMIEQDKHVKQDVKGKGKAHHASTPEEAETRSLSWKNAMEDKENKVYKGHGLRVFEGFGPHIRKFGMSFEVHEDALEEPPVKKPSSRFETYYGSYEWPNPEYCRFGELAGLERTADETSQMKAAMAHLDNVQCLALSLDSGLGWLSGPDKSLCSQIKSARPTIFGYSPSVKNYKKREQDELWEAIYSAHQTAGTLNLLKHSKLGHAPLNSPISAIPGLSRTAYSDTSLWSTMDVSAIAEATPALRSENGGISRTGMLYTYYDPPQSDEGLLQLQETVASIASTPLQPAQLQKHQKEWLLEAEWAQRAFLMSYMLAIVDNGPTFSQVTTLNLAQISSRFLPLLSRPDFWSALPNLNEVTLKVKPDWRYIGKDEAGVVETQDIMPSDAVDLAYEILRNYIGRRISIRKLLFGWIGSGEHAEGMFARNNYLMPAPITRLSKSMLNLKVDADMITLPYIEDFTLSNCWLTPTSIVALVTSLEKQSLKKMTFDSVSLTAHPRYALGAHGGPNQQLAQMWALQAPPPPPPPFPPPPVLFVQPAGQWGQPQAQLYVPPWQPQPPPIGNGALPQHFNNQPANFWPQNLQPPANVHGHTPTQPWYAGHREGSWPEIISALSPGTTLDSYRPRNSWDTPLPPRNTSLTHLEFISCGYARISQPPFDQSTIEVSYSPYRGTDSFTKRRSALYKSMLETNDRHKGLITQHMPEREADALVSAWGMRMGWEDGARKVEPEFDAFLPGGTGRFSGVVRRVDEWQATAGAEEY
ncbi:hypothetical protein M8818_007613 [Zalaria obscura]|uniref:Uncharacterized protein n=1 Tax=Zalaria obscura TaxID=2024903 RepID=A0ACC3S5H5_9PEZI